MNKAVKIPEKYIPFDKSWIIRMGVLDIIHNHKDIQNFLNKQNDLGEDILALKRVAKNWASNEPLDVGESGTLYRLLKFASWKFGLNKKFITRGTLSKRKITDDPKIVNYPIIKLLKLDNGTSQWATASVLFSNKERVKNPPYSERNAQYIESSIPYKLQLTYEAVNHWDNQRQKNKTWVPRPDETILRQAETFVGLLNKHNPNFKPRQPEDYCFARVFNYITKTEGKKKWSSLKGHESDRISEMETIIQQTNRRKSISSKDHRTIQAIAMWAEVNNIKVEIKYPDAVNKSWPQFWDFLRWTSHDTTQTNLN